jgi:hypothetical protein
LLTCYRVVSLAPSSFRSLASSVFFYNKLTNNTFSCDFLDKQTSYKKTNNLHNEPSPKAKKKKKKKKKKKNQNDKKKEKRKEKERERVKRKKK